MENSREISTITTLLPKPTQSVQSVKLSLTYISFCLSLSSSLSLLRSRTFQEIATHRRSKSKDSGSISRRDPKPFFFLSPSTTKRPPTNTLLETKISINLLFTALPSNKTSLIPPKKSPQNFITTTSAIHNRKPSSSPDHPTGSPGSIPMRCYLPRAADSLRPAARRFFFSQPTSGANSTAVTTTATTTTNTATGKYYFSDTAKARDLNNNNAPSNNKKNSKKDKKAAKGSKDGSQVPSRWYTVLALPFPDQTVGRRDILGTAYGRRRRQQLEQQQQQREDERPRVLRPKKSTPSPALSSPTSTKSKVNHLRLFSNNGAEFSDSVSSVAGSPRYYRRPPTLDYYRSDSQSPL